MDPPLSPEELLREIEGAQRDARDVERRIDDLEVALIGALQRTAVASTAEERLAALDDLCEELPTMKAHRTAGA